MKKLYSPESELLYLADHTEGLGAKPESMPCFLTTAFVMDDLTELKEVTKAGGYTYIRKNNPNRTELAKTVSYLENGEDSLIFSSGMGAITTSFLTVVRPGDQVICNSSIYGETYEVMTELLPMLGAEVSFVDCGDLAAVRAAITPKTRLIHTEVVSNPTMALCDIGALAAIAHEAGALLSVDNTFTTPFAIEPLTFGADLSINSLTKFMNGHSDAVGGSVTGKGELINRIQHMSMLCGTPGDPFSSWLILRGLQTAALRVPRQMENAAKLAAALEKNPHVTKVNHPSLESHPQHQLSKKLFNDNRCTAMLSFILPEDQDKIDKFIQKLRFPHYAPTLGGVRSSLSYPVISSHAHVPYAARRAMGITPGMLRISVGIEKAEDLIADIEQALSVFDE